MSRAVIDIELWSCADLCVRENEDGTYTIELGAAVEVVSEDTMRSIIEHLVNLGRDKGWLVP